MGEQGMHGAGMGMVMFLLVVLAVLGVVALAGFFRRPVDVRTLGAPTTRPPAGSLPGDGEERDTWLLIPDISGYTRFISMTRFAAGHAQFVVARLLEAMMEAAEPPMTATRVEGDSVMFHAVSGAGDRGDGVPGAAVAEAVVRLVRAFHERRAALVAANLCPCEACKHVEELEIKVVVHRGVVVGYRLHGLVDLSGLAVIEVHRLLKNSLASHRYALITEAAAGEVRLPWPRAGGWHTERYADVGTIRCVHYSLPAGGAALEPAPGPRLVQLASKLASNARTLKRPRG